MCRTKRYCAENDIPIHDCGLLVVATTDREVERLDGVQRRAEANGIAVERLETEAAIREREPNVRGSEALYTPDSATVDTGQIVADLASTAQRSGVDFHLGYEVTGVTAGRSGVVVGPTGSLASGFASYERGRIDVRGLEVGVGRGEQGLPQACVPRRRTETRPVARK